MEGSKSGGNKEKTKNEDKNTANNHTVIDIVEPGIEQEIKNVIMTADCIGTNDPCCSWKDPTAKLEPTRSKSEPTHQCVNENSSEPSLVSVTALKGSTHECLNHEHIFESQGRIRSSTPNQNSHIPAIPNVSPELFTGLETIEKPCSEIAPPTYPETFSEVTPSANRGIPVLNLPTDSMTQRRDPMIGPPPSYSKSLLDRRMNPCASIQFVAPIPPPSYDGMDNELRYAAFSGFTLGLGNTWQSQPQPAYCPVCETVIITQVDVHISKLAHIIALITFLMLCWPFCLLPYFLHVCNYTFHYCSVCHSFLGARRPFQRT